MKNSECSNWYFVESPLQLINAFEAVNYFSPESHKNTFFIRKLSNKHVNEQVTKTLRYYDVSQIRIVYLGVYFPKLYFFNVLTIIFRIVLATGKNKFYLGEFNSFWSRVIPYIFSKSQFVLFDDGSMTIALHHYKYDFSKYRGSAKWKKNIKIPFFKILFNGVEKITLFTMYNLNPYPKQKYFKNSFSYFRKKTAEQNSNDEIVYFLGGNFVESEEIKETDYIELLTKIFTKYTNQNKKIRYIPHRWEQLEKFNELKNEFESSFKIIRSDVPVEIYFLNQNEKPINIAGLGSTALYTLSKMYKLNDVVSYRIPKNILAENIVELTDIITDYYENCSDIKYQDI